MFCASLSEQNVGYKDERFFKPNLSSTCISHRRPGTELHAARLRARARCHGNGPATIWACFGGATPTGSVAALAARKTPTKIRLFLCLFVYMLASKFSILPLSR